MEIFDRIGQEIEDVWRGENYDEALLPSISADALRRAEIPSKTTVWEMVEWALSERELPRQRDLHANFGDPPVTVFSAPRFHIDVYFWFNGTTSIHQHSFCGAFQVMHGSSIHSWYEFDCEKKVNTFTEIGTMKLKKCELLSVGDVQEILAGKEYIHSLFHLDHPSATIVVRTDRSPLHLPQYNYHKPKLAIDPFFEQETVTKKKQLASALVRAKHPEADRLIAGLIVDSDLQTTFELLSSLRHLVAGDGFGEMFKVSDQGARFRTFLDAATERHGADADVLREVLERQEMIEKLTSKRQFVTDAEHRFFLALLMNVEGREPIFQLVRQRFPDAEPMDKVLDWTFDLANTRLAGTDRSNVLGIEDFGDLDISILEQMLLGRSGSEINDALADQLGSAAEGIAGTIRDKERRIREAGFFRPLLT